MRYLLTLFLLLTASPAWAFSPAIQAVLSGGGAAADGPNAWYYSCTATPTTEPTWDGTNNWSNTTANCAPITLAAGSLTKLSIYSGETYTEYVKLALYDSSGTLLSVACTTDSFVNATWMDCTLGTAYTVSATTYKACFMPDVNNTYSYYIAASSPSYETSKSYASFPYATLSLTAGTNCAAIRGYVD